MISEQHDEQFDAKRELSETEQFESNEAYNAWLDIISGNCGPSA